MKLKSTIRKKAEQGIAMMVALLALLLLAAVGMGLMFMADTENSINNNYRDAQKAYFAARAGAEDVRVLLAPKGALNAKAMAMDGIMPSTTNSAGVIYVMNPAAGETIDPTTDPYLDDELCQEQFVNLGIKPGAGPCPATEMITSSAYTPINNTTPLTLSATDMPGAGGPDALAFKWVRITNKQNLMGLVNQTVDGTSTQNGLQVCWDGAKEFTVPAGQQCNLLTPAADPVWLLTSLAITPRLGQNPGSRRMVQMEVALTPPLVPKAPISTQDPVTLQGSYVINAYDNCTCSCTKDSSGNTTCTSLTAGQQCGNQAPAVYTAGTVSVLGSTGSTITDPSIGSPYVTNVNPWPYNIDQLINQYKSTASTPGWSSTCTGTADFFSDPPVYENCGTQSSQVFGSYPTTLPTEPDPSTLNSVTEYIPGSVHLTSGTSGSGILIVDGDLQLDGGLNWYGLILVRGQVTFTGGSGSSNTGDVNLYGSILAGQDVTASNSTVSSPDGDKFGGSINFHYDVCALKNNGLTRPPRLLATHELSF